MTQNKKPPKKKPSQKERFIAAAKELGVTEAGFTKIAKKILKSKK